MASIFERSGTWYVRFRGPDGWTQRATEARSKIEAKALAAELELQEQTARRAKLRVTAGLYPAQEDLSGTLGDLCDWWLAERCPEASRDIEGRRLKKHVIGTKTGAIPLQRLRHADLDGLLHGIEKSGAAPASINKVRAVLHVVFAKARRAGRWIGENPLATTEPRKVPKRVYVTLTPEQLARMLEQVPEDWRPLFACGPALGLRKGELFALRKSDVDLERGTITVARSHERDTTKSSAAAVLPLPSTLRPWIEHQLKHAPGALLFPMRDGSQRLREADPQKILRTGLSHAGITNGYDHRCRWCGHREEHRDREPRFCPTCVSGRMLWPKAIPLPMRFHDLRHLCATEMLRSGVDVHRVQRRMRHSDVRVTTGTYAHLLVEDLRAAVDAQKPVANTALAAFLLHEAKNSAEKASAAPATTDVSEEKTGGRWGIRTLDPCRVKAVLYR